MRAKVINEIDDSLFKPKELKGAIKKIHDAKEDLEKLGIDGKILLDTINIGILSFSLFNDDLRNYKFTKRIDVKYFEKDKWNNYVNNVEQYTDEYRERWTLKNDSWAIYSASAQYPYTFFDNWEETKEYLLNILFPNIEKELENTKDNIENLQTKLSKLIKYLENLQKINKFLNES